MKHSITISKTAHYYVQYPVQKVESILLVIHGYAQLAQDFIKDFKSLEHQSILVVAPEALSKFYNKNREPVANWMTSHERECEIQDYVNYLNQVMTKIQEEFIDTPISILGFSQGVSTVLRWATQTNLTIQEVHLCAGTIPPELTDSSFTRIKKRPFYYYYGNEDKLLRPEVADEQLQFLTKLNLTVKSIPFKGRHEIPDELVRHFTT